MAEFGDNKLRRVGVDALVDRDHRAHFHEHLHHIYRTFRHTVGEFLHGNGFRNNYFTDDLFLHTGGRTMLRALGFFTLTA